MPELVQTILAITIPIIVAIYLAWRQLREMLKQQGRVFRMMADYLTGSQNIGAPGDLPSAAGAENTALPEQWQRKPRQRHLWVVKVFALLVGLLGVLVTWLRGQWHTAAGVAAMMSVAGVLITASGPAPAHPGSPLPEATQPATTAPLMLPPAPPTPEISVTAPGPASSAPRKPTSPVILTATATRLTPVPPLPTLINPLPTSIAPPSSTECVVELLDLCVAGP